MAAPSSVRAARAAGRRRRGRRRLRPKLARPDNQATRGGAGALQRFRRFTPNTLDDGFPRFLRSWIHSIMSGSDLRQLVPPIAIHANKSGRQRGRGREGHNQGLDSWVAAVVAAVVGRRASAFDNAHSFVSGVNSTWVAIALPLPLPLSSQSSLLSLFSPSLPFFTLFPLNCDGSADLQFRPLRQRFPRPLPTALPSPKRPSYRERTRHQL